MNYDLQSKFFIKYGVACPFLHSGFEYFFSSWKCILGKEGNFYKWITKTCKRRLKFSSIAIAVQNTIFVKGWKIFSIMECNFKFSFAL